RSRSSSPSGSTSRSPDSSGARAVISTATRGESGTADEAAAPRLHRAEVRAADRCIDGAIRIIAAQRLALAHRLASRGAAALAAIAGTAVLAAVARRAVPVARRGERDA